MKLEIVTRILHARRRWPSLRRALEAIAGTHAVAAMRTAVRDERNLLSALAHRIGASEEELLARVSSHMNLPALTGPWASRAAFVPRVVLASAGDAFMVFDARRGAYEILCVDPSAIPVRARMQYGGRAKVRLVLWTELVVALEQWTTGTLAALPLHAKGWGLALLWYRESPYAAVLERTLRASGGATCVCRTLAQVTAYLSAHDMARSAVIIDGGVRTWPASVREVRRIVGADVRIGVLCEEPELLHSVRLIDGRSIALPADLGPAEIRDFLRHAPEAGSSGEFRREVA